MQQELKEAIENGEMGEVAFCLKHMGRMISQLFEINKIESLQQELNQVTFQLGQLEISKIRLKKSEEQLLDILNEVEKKEKDLASELNKKYGRGTLDTKTGNFTPIG